MLAVPADGLPHLLDDVLDRVVRRVQLARSPLQHRCRPGLQASVHGFEASKQRLKHEAFGTVTSALRCSGTCMLYIHAQRLRSAAGDLRAG